MLLLFTGAWHILGNGISFVITRTAIEPLAINISSSVMLLKYIGRTVTQILSFLMTILHLRLIRNNKGQIYHWISMSSLGIPTYKLPKAKLLKARLYDARSPTFTCLILRSTIVDHPRYHQSKSASVTMSFPVPMICVGTSAHLMGFLRKRTVWIIGLHRKNWPGIYNVLSSRPVFFNVS